MSKSAVRLSPGVQRRLIRLLPMEYKPSEIADELGVGIDSVRQYIRNGCPARRDKGGRYWLPGNEFVKWSNGVCQMSAQRKIHVRAPMQEDEFWCMHCHSRTIGKEVHNRAGRKAAICPDCGGKLSKFVRSK